MMGSRYLRTEPPQVSATAARMKYEHNEEEKYDVTEQY